MVSDIKVSVIIPAYNCEKVIPQTLNALTGQTFTSLEILVLNDGSTDSTRLTVEQLASEDRRIKVISLKNGGPAKARNVGLSQAVGEYVIFVDSDDLLEPDAVEQMYNLASKNGLDICACGYVMETPDGQPMNIFAHPGFVAQTKEAFREQLTSLIKAHMMYVIWNKLYRRAFLLEHNLVFTDFLSGEDRLFNIQSFKHIASFGFIDRPLYHYIQWGKSSLANKYISNRFESTLKAHLDIMRAYKEMGMFTQKNNSYLEFIFIKGIVACFCQMFLPACPLSRAQKYQYIRSTLEMPWVKEAVKSYDEEFAYSKRVNAVLRKGNVRNIYLMAKAIYIMQSKFGGLFQKMKHKRK